MIKLYSVWLDEDNRMAGPATIDELRQILASWIPSGTPELRDEELPDQVRQARVFYLPEDGRGIRRRAGLVTLSSVQLEPVYKFSITFDDKPEHALEGEGSAAEVEALIAAHGPAKGYHFVLPNGTPSKKIDGLLKVNEAAMIVVGSGTSIEDAKETRIGTIASFEER